MHTGFSTNFNDCRNRVLIGTKRIKRKICLWLSSYIRTGNTEPNKISISSKYLILRLCPAYKIKLWQNLLVYIALPSVSLKRRQLVGHFSQHNKKNNHLFYEFYLRQLRVSDELSAQSCKCYIFMRWWFFEISASYFRYLNDRKRNFDCKRKYQL